VVKTYAPRGRTPRLQVPLTRDHLAAMGALTWTGEMVIRLQEESVKGKDVVAFLRQLLQHFSGKLLILWDGLPAHRSHLVKDFLRQEAAGRLHLERFPSYAPDLNPVEGLWQQVKQVELRNVCCLHLPHLRYLLSRAIRRLHLKTTVLLGCIRHAGLSPAL
jgi:transposase